MSSNADDNVISEKNSNDFISEKISTSSSSSDEKSESDDENENHQIIKTTK